MANTEEQHHVGHMVVDDKLRDSIKSRQLDIIIYPTNKPMHHMSHSKCVLEEYNGDIDERFL